MRWERGRRSDNVEDRRRSGGGMRLGGLSGGTIVFALLASYFLGVDPMTMLGILTRVQVGGPMMESGSSEPIDDQGRDFVRAILGDTEDTWSELFAKGGHQYQPPRLVLFNGMVRSACGGASAASGPFYCPADQQAYLDLSFFDEMKQRLGGGGDFAEAYVIAHEIGHHVQTLLGTTAEVDSARRGGQDVRGAEGLLVRQELQADCLAGVWAHHAQQRHQWLEPGDVEEALATATAIGDDRLQRQSGGAVVPDAFTHGSAEQRVAWFRQGFEAGALERCDTFAERNL